MAGRKLRIEIATHDNSLDTSEDGELMGMVDEGSYESTEEKSSLVPHSFLENHEENNSGLSFKELMGSGAVTYKLVHMTEDTPTNIIEASPPHILPDAEYIFVSAPTNVITTAPPKKDPPGSLLQAKTGRKRDDKRRATHNEVERRRRDKINTWITKLADLVPNSGLPDSASKGGILQKACDHIMELTEKQRRLEKIEMEKDKLVLEILRLNQEVSELRKENTSMRNQLADNCIVINRPKGQKP